MTPSLSVIVSAEEIGRQAAILLFKRLNGGTGPSRAVILPARLVIRNSCGCWPRHFLRPRNLLKKIGMLLCCLPDEFAK